MDRGLFWMILAGTLTSVIGTLIQFEEETISISPRECVSTFLMCYGNESSLTYVSLKLDSDYIDVASVRPGAIFVECPGQKELTVCGGNSVGHTIISAVPNGMTTNKEGSAFLHVNVNRVRVLEILSSVVGWAYFFAWSISFYPQVWINYSRKSVVGLNFDFLSLNLIGFIMYSLFNCGMYYNTSIQKEYLDAHQRGLIPVLFNDVFFSVHAALLVLVQIFQCYKYERGDQCVSMPAIGLICVYTGIFLMTVVLAVLGIITWCDFLYICSYIKLSITLIKYIPQAYFNYTRKSTEGWSIENIFLDFTGGVLSILQMVINSYNYNDWMSIFGDFTKFGLGAFSILFDIFFMYQHYVLYKGTGHTFDLKGI